MFKFREVKETKKEGFERKLNETCLSENEKIAVREAKAFWDNYFTSLQADLTKA